MTTYTIIITEKDRTQFTKELTGQFISDTKEHAIQEAKDFYSQELDTTSENIEIISII